MVEGMEGEWTEGWTEGWSDGWQDGLMKGGMEPEKERLLEAGVMERELGEGRRCSRWKVDIKGFSEGYSEGWRQGCREARTEGGMEAGMLDGGMGKGWREGWREGWKLSWMNSIDDGNYLEREGGRDGGMGWRDGWQAGFRNGSKEGWMEGGIEGMMDGDMEEWKDFECDIDKLETEMELINFIKGMIYHSPLKSFLSKGRYLECDLDNVKKYLDYFEVFLPTTTFRVQSDKNMRSVFNDLVDLAKAIMIFKVEGTRSSRLKSRSGSISFGTLWMKFFGPLVDLYKRCKKWDDDREKIRQSISNVIDAVGNPLYDANNILPKLELSDITPDLELCLTNEELLLIKAFPALGELKESSEIFNFLLEVTNELQEPIEDICSLCESSLAFVFLGSLLSFKRPDHNTWSQVYDGLVRYRFPGLRTILAYCIDDLSSDLQACLHYSACYPIGSEIPATRLTEIWIADGFVKPDKGETLEDTANKYLEEFVKRSLVWVSRRSSSGRIKYFQIPRVIHEIIHYNTSVQFNPDMEFGEIDSMDRVVIHPGNNSQYREVRIDHLRCFLAFDLDSDILGRCPYLRVLELRNSTIRETILSKLHHLQHLGLRGSNISMLPENINNMKYLRTLDVRDTSVETLPESLWTILALRHVYTNPSPQIQGPPPTANLPNLQTLKTVVVPESWRENFPHSLINLRKLALSNKDNPTDKPNPYWKSIYNLLSQVANLLSMTIKGDIVPAEFVDTRAFPNLETVKCINFEGRWNYFKLTIDNNGFPPNLTKLTLTKSGLKEDPMPRLERLQALKYLSLKNGAYMGKKMVCSANGFPQLNFLELSGLNNLEIWEADPMAMPQLTKLRVVKCCKLEKLPNLKDVDKELIEMQLSLSLF